MAPESVIPRQVVGAAHETWTSVPCGTTLTGVPQRSAAADGWVVEDPAGARVAVVPEVLVGFEVAAVPCVVEGDEEELPQAPARRVRADAAPTSAAAPRRRRTGRSSPRILTFVRSALSAVETLTPSTPPELGHHVGERPVVRRVLGHGQ